MVTFEILLKNYIEQAKYQWKDILTDFVPVSDIYRYEEMLLFSQLNYRIDGGYDDAERVRLLLTQQDYDLTQNDMELSVVSYSGNTKFIDFSHRDCLGALMAQGFERKCIGDILVREDGFDVITNTTINNFLLANDLKIRHVPMRKKNIEISKWMAPERRMQEVNISVQQLRIDAIIAKVFNVSRSIASNYIRAGQVKINQHVIFNPDKMCKQEDIVSMQGFGKFCITDIHGINKKGKLRISVGKYI